MVVIWGSMVCWGIWTVYWLVWDDSTKKFWSLMKISLLGHLHCVRQHQDDLQCPLPNQSIVKGNSPSVLSSISAIIELIVIIKLQSRHQTRLLLLAPCIYILRLFCFFLLGPLLPCLSAVCCNFYVSVRLCCLSSSFATVRDSLVMMNRKTQALAFHVKGRAFLPFFVAKRECALLVSRQVGFPVGMLRRLGAGYSSGILAVC